MIVTFHIHYHTHWGQKLLISGEITKSLDSSQKEIPLHYMGGGNWQLSLEIDPDTPPILRYNYFLSDENNGRHVKEWGPSRSVALSEHTGASVQIRDYWRSRSNPTYNLLSSAFTRAIMPRQTSKKADKVKGKHILSLKLLASRLPADSSFCVSGNIPALGNWEESKALILSDTDFPVWKTAFPLTEKVQEIAYKYGIYDKKTKKILSWEQGENRHIRILLGDEQEHFIQQDEVFRYGEDNWRGSGVSLPVFSIRSKKSWGLGDFGDLKLLIDWAASANQKLVQILPINDTTATHTWVDSYPYAAISVFALHPQYLVPEKMGKLEDKKFMAVFRKEAKKLNALAEIDFEGVMALKMRYIKLLFNQEKDTLKKDKAYQAFIQENKEWLIPYAVFSHLRDQYKTVNFLEWKEHSHYDAEKIATFNSSKHTSFDEISIHYFIQYHLHLQLSEASAYARQKSIVLKGDIPIGIYRYSVDAWMAPHLYNMEAQAGAPPDDFAVEGQNWGFPTYNWEEMAKDDFLWWRKRLSHMARYFDAYRIDHILGFFRIWQVPYAQVQGLLGIFNPALPYSTEDLNAAGLSFHEDRFCKPFIPHHLLEQHFGEDAARVKDEFFENIPSQASVQFKQELSSQRAIQAYIQNKKETPYYKQITPGLTSLIGEFLFHKETREGTNYFHPRIAFHYTHSFQSLEPYQKQVLEKIYTDYFYHRHEEFWKNEALIKLPAIVDATEMLVCGEDLGMVPDSVASVMEELGLLSLEIQRMPKDTDREFGDLTHVPYLSVVSPSSHDMAPLRAWWEEDVDRTQRFYNHALNWFGKAPFYCEPDVCEEVIRQHLDSPSMWAIFPLQDLLSIDPKLRRENPFEERINIPANSQHYWRYRLHIPIEDLLKEKQFIKRIKDLLEKSGRNQPY